MPDDLAPKSEIGVSSFDFSQTDASDPPFGEGVNLDAMNIDVNTLQGISDEDIQKSTFRPVPPGVHELEIWEIEFDKNAAPQTIGSFIRDPKYPDGARSSSYDSIKVKFKFCIPGDENCQITDTFILPPMVGRPNSLYSYENGYSDAQNAAKGGDQGCGFHAKKWRYFLNRLFVPDANGQAPPEASKPKNWIYYPGTQVKRRIILEVTPPKVNRPYPKKDPVTGRVEVDPVTGKTVMVTPTSAFSQVKLYSYKAANDPPELAKFRHAASLPTVTPVKDKKKAAV